MIILDMDMPTNCVECDEIGIRAILECRLIFSGCANCGRHPNCPIKAEIPKNATNGDVMMSVFKEVRYYSDEKICAEWWNAPWKGQENECCK